MTTFSVPIFGAVFEVHFGVHFGLFLDSDLLVLRDFLDFEVPFRAFFRRVFDRTFHHDFYLRRLTGHVVVVSPRLLGLHASC